MAPQEQNRFWLNSGIALGAALVASAALFLVFFLARSADGAPLLAAAFSKGTIQVDETLSKGPLNLWRSRRDCEIAHLAVSQVYKDSRYLFAPRLPRDPTRRATTCEMVRDTAWKDPVARYRTFVSRVNPAAARFSLDVAWTALPMLFTKIGIAVFGACAAIALLAFRRSSEYLLGAAICLAAGAAGALSSSIGFGALTLIGAAALALTPLKGRQATTHAIGCAAILGVFAAAFDYYSGLALAVLCLLCLLLSLKQARSSFIVGAAGAYVSGAAIFGGICLIGAALSGSLKGADLETISKGVSDLPVLLEANGRHTFLAALDDLADTLFAGGWAAPLLAVFLVFYVWIFGVWGARRIGIEATGPLLALAASALWFIANPIKILSNPEEYILVWACAVITALTCAAPLLKHMTLRETRASVAMEAL